MSVLDEREAQAACDLLWQHWQQGTRLGGLPVELRPATLAEGYAIQACLERRSAAPLRGWKIAATSAAGQAHINVDGPIAGRLLAERVHAGGTPLSLGTNQMRVVEPEFAFRIARDLPPRAAEYGLGEVMAAVGDLHLALEVPDSRYEDFTAVGAPQLIADDACAHHVLLGPAATREWRALDLAGHRVVGRVSGHYEDSGSGANVLGDPRRALAWLANELSGIGATLKAGQVVITGTCMTPLPVRPGDEVTADFGLLGTISGRFAR
jgi:2-keto-4-pentenoate hydratase